MPTRKDRTLAAPRVLDAQTPRFRSGAVARMVRMPVATLRIWERRYGVAAPATTPSGHRLYSAIDVQRLALLRQLTERGHSIGAIASLDLDGLREVAATHAATLAKARQAPPPAGPLRVVLVGPGLAQRLQAPATLPGRPLKVVARFDDLATARKVPVRARADLLLLASPSLHEDMLAVVGSAARAWNAPSAAVLYGFGTRKALDAFAGAGIALRREPQDAHGLASWLQSLGKTADAEATVVGGPALPSGADLLVASFGDIAPRRYDDATLADFAGLSSTIACECPRHVAELLVQLSHFEAYSAECRSRSPKDAALHDYLGRVAAASRSLFEVALERIAIEEGLMLPA